MQSGKYILQIAICKLQFEICELQLAIFSFRLNGVKLRQCAHDNFTQSWVAVLILRYIYILSDLCKQFICPGYYLCSQFIGQEHYVKII